MLYEIIRNDQILLIRWNSLSLGDFIVLFYLKVPFQSSPILPDFCVIFITRKIVVYLLLFLEVTLIFKSPITNRISEVNTRPSSVSGLKTVFSLFELRRIHLQYVIIIFREHEQQGSRVLLMYSFFNYYVQCLVNACFSYFQAYFQILERLLRTKCLLIVLIQ